MEKRLFHFSYGGIKPFGKYLPANKKLVANFKFGDVYGISIIKGVYFNKFPRILNLYIKNHSPNDIIVRIEKKLYSDIKTLHETIYGNSIKKVTVNITEKDIKELTIAVFKEEQQTDDTVVISLSDIKIQQR